MKDSTAEIACARIAKTDFLLLRTSHIDYFDKYAGVWEIFLVGFSHQTFQCLPDIPMFILQARGNCSAFLTLLESFPNSFVCFKSVVL